MDEILDFITPPWQPEMDVSLAQYTLAKPFVDNSARRLIEAYATKARIQELEFALEEVASAERFAWSDEDGNYCKTKILRSNMAAYKRERLAELNKENEVKDGNIS